MRPNTSDTSQAAEQLKTTLSSADSSVNQGIQTLGLGASGAVVPGFNRTVAALTAQYGANDPRVKAAQAAVTATKTTIARVSMAGQQAAAPAVQVAKAGWALQGHVLDAQLQPAARFTVFLVDANKTFLQQCGFAYTDDTGYFLINYAGRRGRRQRHPGTNAGSLLAAWRGYSLWTQQIPSISAPLHSSPCWAPRRFKTSCSRQMASPSAIPPKAIRAVALPGKGGKARPGTTEARKAVDAAEPTSRQRYRCEQSGRSGAGHSTPTMAISGASPCTICWLGDYPCKPRAGIIPTRSWSPIDPAKTLLVDQLGLPFSEVSTELERLRDVDPGWWATLGKLVAYSIQDRPFVHLDSDVFLWKGLPHHLLNSPVFTQNPEGFHHHDPHYRPQDIEWAFGEEALKLPVGVGMGTFETQPPYPAEELRHPEADRTLSNT